VLQTEGEAGILCQKYDISDTVNTAHYNPLNEPSGFVFAPFTETAKTPTLLIRPDVAVSGWELIELETRNLQKTKRISLSSIELDDRTLPIDEHDGYKVAFRSFKYQLDRENYQKLVLSFSQLKDWRESDMKTNSLFAPWSVFPILWYILYTPVSEDDGSVAHRSCFLKDTA
jgi:hypothetical protein